MILIFCFIGISSGVSQNKTKYVTMSGDTYTIQMFRDWVPSTGVTEKMGPHRFKILGYEATTFLRCAPNNIRKDQCGSVLKVTEIKGCKSSLEILKIDSCSLSALDCNIVCHRSSGEHVKYVMSVVTKPHRDPDEKEASSLKIINWYIQGQNNSYCISVSGCKMFADVLPQVKALVNTLKELSD